MKGKTKIGLILVAIMVAVVLTCGCIHEDVKDIKMLFPMSGGFTFSPIDENVVVYAIPDSNGINQIHRRYLDTGEDICLTCNNENGPPNGLYKGAPEFHPDGEHVILQVEMEEHPFEDELGAPGAGWFNNIWMTTIDGDQWWQLTDYPHGEQDCYGVLIPKISHDGGKVAWAQLYKGDPEGQYYYKQGKIVPNTNPWGFWQLNIADLLIDGNDVCLENITSSRPGDGNFFEPQCWSPDDKKLLFAADIQKDHVHKLDIWMMDVETQELTQLTDTDDAWEEFASFSPDGKKISFMSSECCDWDPMSPESIPFESTLMTELYIMNSDGTEKVQITNINEEGLPRTEWDKYLQGRQIITMNTWSSDGKKIFFGMVFSAKNGNPLGAAVWQLTFKDTCDKYEYPSNINITKKNVGEIGRTLDRIHTDGNVMLDSSGGTVVLRGFVTITHNNPGADEVHYTRDDYERMRSMGVNIQSIRVFAGLIGAWPGYSPNNEYLEKLDMMVSLGWEAGIYSEFKLTMYDIEGMYGENHDKYWGDIWRNTNGEQEKIISAWSNIWNRYKNDSAVIGYDILNEPCKGDLYASNDTFVEMYLNKFYQKAIDELRKIDGSHIAFIQPALSYNLFTGDITYLSYTVPISRADVGYAPHFYANIKRYATERYSELMDKYINEAEMHDAPLFLGEFGEPWDSEDDDDIEKEMEFQDTEKMQLELFDEAMTGASRPWYADDKSQGNRPFGHAIIKGFSGLDGPERKFILDIFVRPYPKRTAGKLTSFGFDTDKKGFSMTYMPNSSLGATDIFIPRERHYSEGFTVAHNAGLTLKYDPAQPSKLGVVENSGHIDVNRFSWDEKTQILKIDEWLTEENVSFEITPDSTSDNCPINITVINENGGRVSWSHSGNNLIAFDKRGADEYFDIYTMNPDGSNEICLAGNHPGLPGKHTGNPEWHPTGEYIVFQAEKKNHPDINSDLTAPGIGYYNDLWVMTSDGENVWQLTDLTTTHVTSVLHPQFSHDGSKLLWSETLAYRVMALKIADFVVGESGPHLENITMYQPGDTPRFYETHGFSPDDKAIIFTASIETGMHWTGMDIYTMNLETMTLERLTSTLDEWDEHAHYSPDGTKIVWMSSIGYPFNPGTIVDLRTDLWMMDADGSNKTRLTYFNELGYPEYTGRQTVVGDCSWSPDGTKLVVKAQLYHGLKEDIQILIIEFVDDKPYLFIEKPALGSSYVFDRELRQIKPDKCKIFGKITVEVDAYDENEIDRVEFFIDDVLKDTDTESPYEWTWRGFAIGKHTIKTTVYDTNGNAASDDIAVWRFF